MKYTKEFIEKETARTAPETLKGLQEDPSIPEEAKSRGNLQHLWVVGTWLQSTLEELGHSEEKASSICREHGQRSFHTNPYEVAAWILNEIEAGTFVETPMEELGRKLLEENTRVEVRNGQRTVVMTVWNPDAAEDLIGTVQRIHNLPDQEREAEIAKIQAEIARMESEEHPQ